MDESEVQLRSALTLELDGGERPTLGLGHFSTGNVRRYTPNRRLSGSIPCRESKPDPLDFNLAAVRSKLFRHFPVSFLFLIIATDVNA